jgi:hypothetical protein
MHVIAIRFVPAVTFTMLHGIRSPLVLLLYIYLILLILVLSLFLIIHHEHQYHLQSRPPLPHHREREGGAREGDGNERHAAQAAGIRFPVEVLQLLPPPLGLDDQELRVWRLGGRGAPGLDDDMIESARGTRMVIRISCAVITLTVC